MQAAADLRSANFLVGRSGRWEEGVHVAAVMPPRYVPRVINDERKVRAECEASHLADSYAVSVSACGPNTNNEDR